jgi:drug/metabolite transporter (DMT)-like permease
MTKRGWLLFGALAIIWGVPYFFIKIAVREVSPALLVLIRTGGGAALLVPLAAFRGALRPVLRAWKPLLVYSGVEIGVPWFLLFSAEQHLSSSLAGLLIATVPLMAAALAWATGSERLGPARVVGLVVGLGGVAVLVGFNVGRSSVLAALSIGVVAMGYALGPWVLSRHLGDLPGMGVVAASLGVCAIGYLPIALVELPSRPLAGSVVGSVVSLTVVCTVLAFLVFFALVGEVGPVRTTVITYVNPVVAVLLGVSALGEHFGVSTGVGFALVLVGCFLATRSTGAGQHEPLRVPPVAEP